MDRKDQRSIFRQSYNLWRQCDNTELEWVHSGERVGKDGLRKKKSRKFKINRRREVKKELSMEQTEKRAKKGKK